MKTTIQIQNLKCGGCENTIRNSISKVKNIKNVHIDLEDATISFEYLTTDDINRLTKALSKIGYPLIDEQNSLTKKAKSYVSCAIGRISK